MKNITPYIFPIVALLVVVFLLYRWYDMRTEQVDRPVEFGEGVEIENLSEAELGSVLRGAENVKTVELQAPQANVESAGEAVGSGVIRYDIADNKVRFSVLADLPALEVGAYQVWLKEIDGEGIRKAFSLESGKGGMMGSASVASDLLPFEVVVSKETTAGDETMEAVVLRGVIQAPAEASASPTPSTTPESN